MKSNGYNQPFNFPKIQVPVIPDLKFVVTNSKQEAHALADDKTLIQRAIDTCAQAGGGHVLVPAGEWVTGAIHLRSNIHLEFAENAVVRFSGDLDDYLPVVFTRWEGTECYNYSPLIYANNCENIVISGSGTLFGNGSKWWYWKQLQQEAADRLSAMAGNQVPVQERVYGTEEAALRPSFIQPINCKKVLIEGITLRNGPQWMIHPVYCENVVVREVSVISGGPNNDGLNPDSCNNVLIEDCFFDTGDDCIAINSGMNEDGWRVNKPCENIEIRNCTMIKGHGGITIGSGMSGGVKNVYAHDCDISGCHQGVRLKSMRGRGGYVDGVWIENITLNNLSREAIQINMFYGYSTVIPKTSTPPDFNNIHIKNVHGVGAATAIEICGLPEHKLKEIYLEDIQLEAKTGLVCKDVEMIDLRNVEITSTEGKGAEFEDVQTALYKGFSVR